LFTDYKYEVNTVCKFVNKKLHLLLPRAALHPLN